MDKLSYAWGLAMGKQLQAMGVKEINSEEFKDGVKVAFDGGEPKMPVEEAQKLINDYLQDLEKKAEAMAREEGEKFLAENGKKENVRSTASGLQYVVEKEGDGAQPSASDEVTVHYTGKLLNGTVFDSSVNRGEPATFPLNRVIPGWTEGVQLMKEGAKYTFFIPSDLAYGAGGVPNVIPPHSTLIFEVAEFATDSTYVRTPSGLKYMIEKEGTGAMPGATDQVTVHYTGRLLDGSVFDSSVMRGEPATFPLNGVIAGWTEGLQLMKEGSKYVFYIPSDLAYGARGAGNDIPPYADLIFEVELIKVN